MNGIITDVNVQTFTTIGGGKFYKVGWDDLKGPARNLALKIKDSRPITDCGIAGALLLISDSTLTSATPGGLVLSADLLIEAILAKNGNAYCFSAADIKAYVEAFGVDRVKPWVQNKGASIRDFAVLGDGRRNVDGKKYCGQISILFAAIARAVDEGNTGLLQYLFGELEANPNQRIWAYARSGDIQAQFEPCYDPKAPCYPADVPLLYCQYLASTGASQARIAPIIRSLMNNNADANLPNIQGRTPYMEALRSGQKFVLEELSVQKPDVTAMAAPNYPAWVLAAEKAGKQSAGLPRPKPQSFIQYVCEAAPLWAVQWMYEKGLIQSPEQKKSASDITRARLSKALGKLPTMILDDARLAYFCVTQQFPAGPERASALNALGKMTAGIRGALGIVLQKTK
ncbi:MAG: hypothetical protein EYC62_02810 [Alphaproteobacteria bacterium]|nr:MAG: hypothetical protein EYC62_02810 [Alphaproteobacteria bacterium]